MDTFTHPGLTSPIGTAIQDIAGPFFLGFSFQFFGMGIVLILSINYFMAIMSHPKTAVESSRGLGVILVAASLALNLVQTIVDLRRGWQMFATNFSDIIGFLKPTPSYFLSPFFGLIPALITQGFLLRRSILFIASLSAFWPRLAHPTTRWVFGCFMGVLILVSAGAGTCASVMVWKAESLWSLDRDTSLSTGFQRAEVLWLTTSSFVDVVLSVALCLELWWARKKLATSGGAMQKVVTRLILITFNGGLAVTTFQLTALFLYQFAKMSSWPYFSMLSISKVYTITLILSLSLHQNNTTGPSPSHVFSLPIITTPHPPSPPLSPHSATHAPLSSVDPIKLDTFKKHPSMNRVRSQVREGWRKSQGWIGWSLVGPSILDRNRSKGRQQGRGDAKGKSLGEDPPGHTWSRHRNVPEQKEKFVEIINAESGTSRLNEYRRPSEPNSMAPLMSSSTSDRRPSTIALLNRSSLFHTSLLEHSPTEAYSPARILAYPQSSTAGSSCKSGIPIPPPSVTIDRTTITGLGERRRSMPAHPDLGRLSALDEGSPRLFRPGLLRSQSALRAIEVADRQGFDLHDPFATLNQRRRGSSPISPLHVSRGYQASVSDDSPTKQSHVVFRPTLSPLTCDRLGVPMHPSIDVTGHDEESNGAEEVKRIRRGEGRMMSFEDMLSGGPGKEDVTGVR